MSEHVDPEAVDLDQLIEQMVERFGPIASMARMLGGLLACQCEDCKRTSWINPFYVETPELHCRDAAPAACPFCSGLMVATGYLQVGVNLAEALHAEATESDPEGARLRIEDRVAELDEQDRAASKIAP